jgi:hypothetical protein
MAKCVNSTTASQVERRSKLRSIMLMAWSSKRETPTRAFADCLRGAWKYTKASEKYVAQFMKRARANGGVVRFSPDLTRSPIKSSLRGKRYGRRTDYQAAYMTARLGY